MTKIIIEKINRVEDLYMFSKAFKEGMIYINITKVAKHLNKDRKTVKRYLLGNIPKTTRKREKYLDQHRDYILEVLSDRYQSFDYIEHLFKYLKRERGIKCSRSSLSRYIRLDDQLNSLFDRHQKNTFTMRFETAPGEQAQFDMKEKVQTIFETGEVVKTYIPTLTLSWSRANFRKLTLDTKVETLLSFLAETFEQIGGVPKTLVIDNLKQFVEKPRTSQSEAILTSKFIEFCKDYDIKPLPSMPYRPQTKGKIETQNKVVDQLKNYNGKYKDLMHVHEILAVINKEDNESISQATKFPRVFLLKKEKGDLGPLPTKEVRQKYHLTLNEVMVSNESLISYKQNKYSVPKTFIGLKVGLSVRGHELHIYYNNKIITIHQITNNLLNIKHEHDLIYEHDHNKHMNKQNETIIHEMRHINYD